MQNPATTMPSAVSEPAASSAAPPITTGMRKNGKNWHAPKKAFRRNAGLTSYEKRKERDNQQQAVKDVEREMRAQKEAERQGAIDKIKQRRERKESEASAERAAKRTSLKRKALQKKKEKRNKLLHS